MNNYYGMEYRGYSFYSEWEMEHDRSNKKLWHYIKDPGGNVSDAPIGGSFPILNKKSIHDTPFHNSYSFSFSQFVYHISAALIVIVGYFLILYPVPASSAVFLTFDL